MRPLAIFAIVAVAGGILIAAGLRLTAHSASATPPPPAPVAATPLSRTQFVRAANHICGRSNRQGNALFTKPRNLRMLAREVRMAVPLLDREIAALRALVPPARDAAAYRRVLDDLGPEKREAHVMLHAFETRQWVRGARAARQLDRLGKQLDKRDDPALKKLGLTVCAKD